MERETEELLGISESPCSHNMCSCSGYVHDVSVDNMKKNIAN